MTTTDSEAAAARSLGVRTSGVFISRDDWNQFQSDAIDAQAQRVREDIAAAPPLPPVESPPPAPQFEPPAPSDSLTNPTLQVPSAPTPSDMLTNPQRAGAPPPLADLLAVAGLAPPADSAAAPVDPRAAAGPPSLQDLMARAGLGGVGEAVGGAARAVAGNAPPPFESLMRSAGLLDQPKPAQPQPAEAPLRIADVGQSGDHPHGPPPEDNGHGGTGQTFDTPTGKWTIAFGFDQPYGSAQFNADIPNHRGVDLTIPGAKDNGRGTTYGAFQPGTVVALTHDPAGGNGIIVQTPDGLYNRYFHNDKVLVGVGDKVNVGDPLGVLGASGTEGFPHLHFEVSRGINGDPMGKTIDPRSYMTAGDQSSSVASPARDVQSATPTTVGLSGGVSDSRITGPAQQTLGLIGQIASKYLGDIGARVAQAVGLTEGALVPREDRKDIGDNAQSFGWAQLYRGGQLPNFASDMGMSEDQAGEYARQHPDVVAEWALSPTGTNGWQRNGYLGNAIRAGQQAGLTGADLATYAQRHGQVSVSPERAGQNYNALFGGGQGVVQAVGGAVQGAAGTAQQAFQNLAQTGGQLAQQGQALIQGLQPQAGESPTAPIEREANQRFSALQDTLNSTLQQGQRAQDQRSVQASLNPVIGGGLRGRGAVNVADAGAGTPEQIAAQAEPPKPLWQQIGDTIGSAISQGLQPLVQAFQGTPVPEGGGYGAAGPMQPGEAAAGLAPITAPVAQAAQAVVTSPPAQAIGAGIGAVRQQYEELAGPGSARFPTGGPFAGPGVGIQRQVVGFEQLARENPEYAQLQQERQDLEAQQTQATGGAAAGDPAFVQRAQRLRDIRQRMDAIASQANRPELAQQAPDIQQREEAGRTLQTVAAAPLTLPALEASIPSIAANVAAVGIDPGNIVGLPLQALHLLNRAGEIVRGVRGAEDVSAPVVRVVGDTPEVRRAVEEAAPVAQDADRFYHGTGTDFARPDAAKFDQSGLFGPGYYLTDDPRVAGGVIAEGGEPRWASAPDVRRGEGWSAPLQRGDVIDAGYAQQRGVDPAATAEADRLERALQNATPQYRADNEGWMQAQIDRLRNYGTGPNVRAVDVPKDLNLLNADAQVTPGAVQTVASALEPRDAAAFQRGVRGQQGAASAPTGQDVYSVLRTVTGDSAETNRVLEQAGFDGIRYSGGQRTPMVDQVGQPIEHTAVVVFPDALDKVRNAVSGRQGGQATAQFATTVGGAAAGGTTGYATTPEDASPPERIARTAAGALGGGALGYAAGRALPTRPPILPVRAAEETTPRAVQAAGEAPHGLTINLPKYTPPEVRDVIQAAYNANPATFDEARRGVVADETVRELADQTGARVDDLIKRWQPGQAQNAETLLAMRQGLANAAGDVLAQQRALQQAADPVAQNAAMARMLEAVTRHAAVQEAVTGVTAEAGRALRQFRQPVSGQQMALDMLQKLAQANDVAPDRLAGILATADLSKPTEVAKLAQVLYSPTWKDKLLAWTVSNMLSGLKSLEINAVGNAIETINRPLINVLGGNFREAFDDVAAMGRATGKAWGDASQTFLTGVRPSDVAKAAAGGKYDVRPEAFPGAQGLVATPALRAMSATDEFFKTVNGAGGYAEEARRIASETRQTVEAVTSNPAYAERLATAAQKAGDIATYQEEASPLAKLLLRGRNLIREPGAGNFATGLAFNVLTPFVHIPDVVYRRGVAMLAEPVVGPIQVGRLAVQGRGYEARQRLGRMMLTDGLLAAIYGEATAGNITGDGPQDAGKRADLEAARDANGDPIWQRHSVRIAGRWFDYSNLGPASVPFAAIASAVEAYREDQTKPDANLAADVFGRTTRVLADASYVKSIGDVFVAINQGRADKLPGTIGGNLLGRFVPFSGAVAQVTRSTEPEVKQPRNPLEQVMARVPGLSGMVPSRVDPTTGQPVQAPQDLWAQISPVRTSAPGEPNPVALEIARLDSAGQSVSVPTARPDMWGSRQSEDQQRLIAEQYGTATNLYVASTINNPKYQALTTAQQADALNKAIGQAREASNITLGTQVARDPHESALWQWATTPQFAGISSKLPPEEVARQNWEVQQARSKLADYRQQYKDAAENRLRRDDPQAYRLSQRDPIDSEILARKKRALDRATGGALLQTEQRAAGGGLPGVGSTVLPPVTAPPAGATETPLPTRPPVFAAAAAPARQLVGAAAGAPGGLPTTPPVAPGTNTFRAQQNADIRAAKAKLADYQRLYGAADAERRLRADDPLAWTRSRQSEV